MNKIRSFLAFWYDFVVGDDWPTAIGVVIGLVITAVLTHFNINAWWLMPAVVAIVFVASIRRASSSISSTRPSSGGSAR